MFIPESRVSMDFDALKYLSSTFYFYTDWLWPYGGQNLPFCTVSGLLITVGLTWLSPTKN